MNDELLIIPLHRRGGRAADGVVYLNYELFPSFAGVPVRAGWFI